MFYLISNGFTTIVYGKTVVKHFNHNLNHNACSSLQLHKPAKNGTFYIMVSIFYIHINYVIVIYS